MTVHDDLATLLMFRDRLPLIDEAEYAGCLHPSCHLSRVLARLDGPR